jgi:hypothetical protein
MNITIQDLLKGKPTIIKNNEFFPTKTYVEPFLERMSKFTDDFRISVKTPNQMTIDKDSTDITYNRVLIEAVLPEKFTIDNHEEVIGFLYGIDVRKPVAKIYKSYLNQACTNMCVFNPDWLNVQELVPGDPIQFGAVEEMLEKTNDFAIQLKKLKNTFLDRDEKTNYLGKWVDATLREYEDYGFGKVKVAVSTPVNAYKELFINAESEYYIPEGIAPSLFDVYNAFTQIITDDDKDILNKFEKTMLVNRLLEI